MKKNGFVSTTLIYTFFIIFLTLMIFLLNSYSRNRYLLSTYRYDIKKSFNETNNATSSNSKLDIELYFLVWNNETAEYELVSDLPEGYNLENEFSSCKNGSTINYVDNRLKIKAKERDVCYLYFKPANEG